MRYNIEQLDEETGSYLLLTPSDQFSIDVQIAFDSEVLSVQNASLSSLLDFEKNISMCRTFVFIKEIKALLKNGLIKGGDLDNAIVIYDGTFGFSSEWWTSRVYGSLFGGLIGSLLRK